jgi:hypothetical protein
MFVTEEEAKTKLCCGPPMQHAIAKLHAGLITATDAEKDVLCVASGCMARRWAEEKNAEAEAAFEATCPTGASMGCEVTGPSPVGYCGIAGRPE